MNVYMDETGRFYKSAKPLSSAHAECPVIEDRFKDACTDKPMFREDIIKKIQGGSKNA